MVFNSSLKSWLIHHSKLTLCIGIVDRTRNQQWIRQKPNPLGAWILVEIITKTNTKIHKPIISKVLWLKTASSLDQLTWEYNTPTYQAAPEWPQGPHGGWRTYLCFLGQRLSHFRIIKVTLKRGSHWNTSCWTLAYRLQFNNSEVHLKSPNLWTVPVQRWHCSLGTTHGGRLPLRNTTMPRKPQRDWRGTGQRTHPTFLARQAPISSPTPSKNTETISDLCTATRGPRSQSLMQPPERQGSTRTATCWPITG